MAYRLIAKAVMGPAKRCWGLFAGGGRWMACLEGEKFDQIAALIESSSALSGVLALMLAGTPYREISASEIDALADLSYNIHLNLNQLKEIWAQVSDEQTKGRN